MLSSGDSLATQRFHRANARNLRTALGSDEARQARAELLAADNVLLPVGRSRFQMMGCDFHLDSRYEAKLIECNPSAGHNWARRLHREDWLETIAMDALKMTKSLKPQPGWTALPSRPRTFSGNAR